MGALPVARAVADVGERFVFDRQQTALLEVGHREPPAPLHIEEQPVGEHVTHGAFRTLLRVVLGVGLDGVELDCVAVGVFRQACLERVEHPLRKVAILETLGAGFCCRGVEAAPHECDLHEVVEVARLK